jgi:hypothetical protein
MMTAAASIPVGEGSDSADSASMLTNGTIALMLFLMVAGFTPWMLNGNSNTAAPSSSESGR